MVNLTEARRKIQNLRNSVRTSTPEQRWQYPRRLGAKIVHMPHSIISGLLFHPRFYQFLLTVGMIAFMALYILPRTGLGYINQPENVILLLAFFVLYVIIFSAAASNQRNP